MGLLSASGALTEHFTWGISEPAAAEFWRSPWVVELIQFVRRQPMPTRLDDLARGQPHLCNPPQAWPDRPAPRRAAQLRRPRRGGLYLCAIPASRRSALEDEETVLTICGWLEQGNLWEETRLLAQLQVLNQVAQAVAGNPDLSRILTVALRELDRQLPLHVCAVWLPSQLTAASGSRWPHSRVAGSHRPRQPGGGPRPRPPMPSRPTVMVVNSSAVAGELGLVPGLRLALGDTPFTVAWRDGQAIYADLGRPEECADGLSRSLAAGGATSSFVVPLRAADRVVGRSCRACVPGRSARPANNSSSCTWSRTCSDRRSPTASSSARLRKAYEELSRTQTQLVQAEKMRALGELAGGMAHEFNNSLCGALGFIEVALLNKSLDASCRGHLQSARTCALTPPRLFAGFRTSPASGARRCRRNHSTSTSWCGKRSS